MSNPFPFQPQTLIERAQRPNTARPRYHFFLSARAKKVQNSRPRNAPNHEMSADPRSQRDEKEIPALTRRPARAQTGRLACTAGRLQGVRAVSPASNTRTWGVDESRFRLRGGSGSIAAVLQHACARLKTTSPLKPPSAPAPDRRNYKAPMRAAGGKSEGRAALGYRRECRKSVRGSVVAPPSTDFDTWRSGHVHQHGQ